MFDIISKERERDVGVLCLTVILTTNYYVSLSIGNVNLIDQLRNDPQLSSNKLAIQALNDLELLFRYLTLFNITDKVT